MMAKINSIVLRIMTVDYQPAGRLHSRLLYNTYALLNQIVPGISAYITYFTLYDPDARGFVRPACLLFLSECIEKLNHVMRDIRTDMVKIIDKMKSANCSLIKCHPLATTTLFTSTISFQTSDLGSSVTSTNMRDSISSTSRVKSSVGPSTSESKRFSLDSAIEGTSESLNSVFTSNDSSGISSQSGETCRTDSFLVESSPRKKTIKSLFAICGISKNVILPYMIRLHAKYSRAIEEILLETHC